jgi:hypothetical protein
MQIYWVQQFWFDNYYNATANTERHYITIDGFGTRNVAVTCALNVFGPGAHIEQHNSTLTGDLGIAAVGIKSYDYVDDQGQAHHVLNDYFVPCAVVKNCTAIEIELALTRAWVGATGSVFYFDD